MTARLCGLFDKWIALYAATPSTEEQALGHGALSPRSTVAEGPTPQRMAASSPPAPAAASSPVPRLPLAEVDDGFVDARSRAGGPESDSDYHSARGELVCSPSLICHAVLIMVQTSKMCPSVVTVIGHAACSGRGTVTF